MTIEEHNTRLSPPCEVTMNESNVTRINVNHDKVAQIMRYWDVHGSPTFYQVKRQLCQTRRHCRTIFMNEIIKLGRNGK